jgi:hypothetical protein
MVATEKLAVSDLFAAARVAGVKPVGDKKVQGKMVIYTFRAPAGVMFTASNSQGIMPSSSGQSVCVGWNENVRGQKADVIGKAIEFFGSLVAAPKEEFEPILPGCELSEMENARNLNAEVDLSESLERDTKSVAPADAIVPVPEAAPEIAVEVLPVETVTAPVPEKNLPAKPVVAAQDAATLVVKNGKTRADWKVIRDAVWARVADDEDFVTVRSVMEFRSIYNQLNGGALSWDGEEVVSENETRFKITTKGQGFLQTLRGGKSPA